MSLEALQLDRLRWADLVELARRRIAPISRGRWTLHAPVDPGVTLLELFAHLLEQRSYWLDHLPDEFVRAALDLLGLAPMPVRAARTVLGLVGPHGRTVKRGTVMRLDRNDSRLAFTTQAARTILAVERIGLQVGNQDRSADLGQGRRLRLLPGSTMADASILLWMDAPPPSDASAPLGVLLELASSADHEFDVGPAAALAPQWSDAAVEVEPPGSLTLRYRSPAGLSAFASIADGTGGLRRSGIVELAIPDDWQPEPGKLDADGRRAWAIHLRAAAGDHTAPPRIDGITVNAVVAEHRVPVRVCAKVEWLPLPGNRFDLPRELGLPIPERTRVWVRERELPDRWRAWTPVADFGRTRAEQRVFVVDRAGLALDFGDGYVARVPRPDLADTLAPDTDPTAKVPNLLVLYEIGGGEAGNLGAREHWYEQRADAIEPVSAMNPVAAIDGREAETLAEARERAAAALRQSDRAITASDFERLAITTAGVAMARAHAEVGRHPRFPCTAVPGAVSVYIVPDAPRERPSPAIEAADVPHPMPDSGALAAVSDRLSRARLAGSEVFVLAPDYRELALRIVVEGSPVAPELIRDRIAAAARRYLDPLIGGDSGTGWPFGEPLRSSALMRIVDRELADLGEVRSIDFGLDGAAPEARCEQLDIEPWQLVALSKIEVRFAATGVA